MSLLSQSSMEMWYNWSMESPAAPSTGQAAEVLTMPGQLLFIYLFFRRSFNPFIS